MFIPLHVKSDYSLGFGTASIEELVREAAKFAYPALALTDIENLYGQVRFHHLCRLHGIRPITGLELRPGFDGRRGVGRRSGRLVLLAADERGYRSLCRIVGRRRGGVRDPEVGSDPLPLTARFSEGLFALSDDPSVVERLAGCGNFPLDRLGMLLVRPDNPPLEARRRAVAERLGVRLVADLDAIFLKEEDRRLHLLQLAIRQGRRLQEVAEGDAESSERRLRSPAEVAALFSDLPGAVAAAQEIAEACRFDIRTIAQGSPGFELAGEAAADRLRRLCEDGVLDRVGGRWNDAYRKRLEDELALFERLGFSGFMVAVAEILAHCREEGIPAAVRGSAVSSLVLHLLGGSPVDPLAHGLLFERFLHPGKSAWPDVDIDLPWHHRDGVIDWVFERFGRDRVAMVAAHHTFQYRSALREGLKAWGARPALVERLSAALPPEDLAVEEVDFLGLAATVRDDPLAELHGTGEGAELAAILPLVRRLVGKPRHIAVHPGGIVMGQPPLEDVLPLELAPKGVVVTQYDLVAVARLGLVKIDLLGNRCLSELEEALTLAGRGKGLRLESIPAEDPQTLALIDRGETIGCFQLESPAMRSLLARLPVRRQSDLIAVLALIRPGAASGEVKSDFVRRARGEEADTNPFPSLSDRLDETHGLFLYEEDIMALLSRIGGMNLEEADELRRQIVESGGIHEVLASLEADFLQRAKTGGADAPLARRAWATAARFAAYSFNKAHAASYALLAYFSAYVKAHHPLEFACALLNHHQGLYPLRTEVGELARMGVELRLPHVNLSGYHSWIEGKGSATPAGAVRVGLDKVKGLSQRGALTIIAERNRQGQFVSLRDLLERVRLSRGEVSALILSGACDGLSPLSEADYPFAHEAVLALLRQGCDPAELDNLIIPLPAAEAEQVRLYRGLVRVKNELRYLEMHLSAHPLALLRPEAKRYGCLTIRRALLLPAGSTVRLAVVIAAMRRVVTRQGAMQFLTLEDETGLLEGAVLPPVYRALGERVTTPGPFLVEGALRRQQGAVHLEMRLLAPFHERRRPFGRT